MLHDITACDEISHGFSHCICRCTVAVFEVCIQVQAGRFLPHERHQCLPRKRRGVENPCTFLIGKISQATLKVIKRWWKIKANGMHSFLLQMKLCPQKSLILADMNLRNFLLSHQIAVLFYWTLGETHEQLDKKIVPSSRSHCLMLNMWTQVTEERLNGESTAEPFYAKTATKDILFSKSDKDAIYWSSLVPGTKWGRIWSNCNHLVTATAECCHDQSCFL